MTNLLFPLLSNLLNGSHCSGFEPYTSGTIGRYYNRIYYYFIKAKARWWYPKNFLGKCLEEM
jgi:hypothetical protein